MAFFLLLLAMPKTLRLEPAAQTIGPNSWSKRWQLLRKLDYPGAFLIVGTSTLLTTALQQAAHGLAFHNAKVLILLVVAAILLIGFVVWEWLIWHNSWDWNPILSWEILTNRVFMFSVW